MTSEVLILNKRAVVIGADSAVTTSYAGDHPRYSKTANKIFELNKRGSIAAAIYDTASLDRVPWELVLKLFRAHLQDGTFSRVSEYVSALLNYLSGNNKIFPEAHRESCVPAQFDEAARSIAAHAVGKDARIKDETLPLDERRNLWAIQAADLQNWLDGLSVKPMLSEAALDALLGDLVPWTQRVQEQLDSESILEAFTAPELAKLAHLIRYKAPAAAFNSSTGLVIAGYGEDQIFPSYEQLLVYGHVGNELYYEHVDNFEVTHTGIAMIRPLAKTSMMDVFAKGFDQSLKDVISSESEKSIQSVFDKLLAAGVEIPAELLATLPGECHTAFMNDWTRVNWENNFYPLLSVLQSLSVQEMAHLAESLLGLESLKERVTSSSETIGGPIDVCAITKDEGLVWIKRKHYFEASLNMRYAARLNRSFE